MSPKSPQWHPRDMPDAGDNRLLETQYPHKNTTGLGRCMGVVTVGMRKEAGCVPRQMNVLPIKTFQVIITSPASAQLAT